jgi:hypothetical protein
LAGLAFGRDIFGGRRALGLGAAAQVDDHGARQMDVVVVQIAAVGLLILSVGWRCRAPEGLSVGDPSSFCRLLAPNHHRVWLDVAAQAVSCLSSRRELDVIELPLRSLVLDAGSSRPSSTSAYSMFQVGVLAIRN